MSFAYRDNAYVEPPPPPVPSKALGIARRIFVALSVAAGDTLPTFLALRLGVRWSIIGGMVSVHLFITFVGVLFRSFAPVGERRDWWERRSWSEVALILSFFYFFLPMWLPWRLLYWIAKGE